MLWLLVRKEIHAHLLTLRLGIALLFAVGLTALTTFIGSLDYSRNLAAYERARQEATRALERATVYLQVQPTVVVPPQPMAIVCRGVAGTRAETVNITLEDVPLSLSSAAGSSESALMKTLTQVDVAGVVAVLLSFLAVVLGFDGICGERQNGTLEQVLANPVPRAHVIAAKLLGGVLCLTGALALAFVVALLVTMANPDVSWAGADWARLALLFLLSGAFLAQVFCLSLLVSACTRDAATSLIVCLFAWLVGTLGWTAILPSLVRYGVEEPPYQEFLDQAARLQQEYEQALSQWEAQHPRPGRGYLEWPEQDGRVRYGHPLGYAWLQRRYAFAVERRLVQADQVARHRWANYEPLAREARLVDAWSRWSPFANYQVLASQLARTTQDDRFYVAQAAARYRQTLIAYLRGKDAFASQRWFSDDPREQEPLVPHPEAMAPADLSRDSAYMKSRLAWAREQEAAAATDPARRLDLTDLPKFGQVTRRPLVASLATMLPGLLVLSLGLIAGALLTVARFRAYQPRGA